MSDEVKIGGDSRELIDAIDRAEARFKRFENTVNSGGFDQQILERQKQIIDSTAQSVGNVSSEVRKATVDWKRLADESKRASDFMSAGATRRASNSAAGFKPAPPGKYDSPEQQRINDLVDSVLKRDQRAYLDQRFTRRFSDNGSADHAFGSRSAGDLINAATGTSGNVTKLGALGALGVGLGPAAAIVATTVAVTKLGAIYRETTQAVRNYHRESSRRPTDIVGAQGQSAILEQLERDRQLERATRRSLGSLDGDSTWTERIASPFRRLFSVESADDIKKQAAERKQRLNDDLDYRSGRELDASREDATGSRLKADLIRAEEATEKEIATIQGNRNILWSEQVKLIAIANEKLAIQKESLKAAHEAQQRQYALAEKLNRIRTDRKSSEVDTAQANVDAAKENLTRARGDEEKAAARSALSTAEAELTIVQNKQRMMDADLRIANLRGAKEIEIAETLREQLEKANLIVDAKERELAVAQANKAIAENESAVALSQIDRNSSRRISDINTDASKRAVDASPEQRQRIALQAQIDAAQELRDAAEQRWKAENGSAKAADEFKDAKNAVLAAEAELDKFDRDTAFAHKQSLNAAKATTTEMQLQSQRQDHLANLTAIRASFEAQIAQAVQNRRPDLVAELKVQERLALAAERYSRWKATGGRPDQPTPAEGVENRARDKFEAFERDEADRSARGAYKTHPDAHGQLGLNDRQRPTHPDAYMGPGDARRSRSLIDQAIDRRWQLDEPRRGSLRSRNDRLSDDDWRDQFKPRSALRERAQAKHAESGSMRDGASLGGKIDIFVATGQTLIATLNALPGKIGVL